MSAPCDHCEDNLSTVPSPSHTSPAHSRNPSPVPTPPPVLTPSPALPVELQKAIVAFRWPAPKHPIEALSVQWHLTRECGQRVASAQRALSEWVHPDEPVPVGQPPTDTDPIQWAQYRDRVSAHLSYHEICQAHDRARKSLYHLQVRYTRAVFHYSVLTTWSIQCVADQTRNGNCGMKHCHKCNPPSTHPLPPGWERRWREDGRVYYVDHMMRRTQWNPPSTW